MEIQRRKRYFQLFFVGKGILGKGPSRDDRGKVFQVEETLSQIQSRGLMGTLGIFVWLKCVPVVVR